MKKIFSNTEVAFALKSDSELNRAHFLFEMIKREPLVKIGTFLTNFALKTHLPVEGLIKATVFDHFCGGVTEDDCLPVIEKMYSKGVSSVLDYSAEGKEEESHFDFTMEKTLKTIDFAHQHQSIPFAVFKPTGVGRFELFQKMTAEENLTEEENNEWERIIKRFDKICQTAHEKDVPVLIDAEESWMQYAADDLIEEMMQRYNKEKAIVYNTLQLYKWNRFDYLESLYERASEKGFKIGLKLVRGAYMEKERERASKKGYISPICKDKPTTDDNYDSVLEYVMERLDTISIFAGTHNEKSTALLLKLMKKNQIAHNDPRVWFGQLYGMSDHISYNLSNMGYNVAKYLPFGPVRDVMPYLIRRAEENTSVTGQTNRELMLLRQEKKRRKL
ncbi:MAG: proline dehydrogenase family protein [Flavobacteriaceae bacterium]|nr:proline dehydrogenase family protein [Flavobacteriaceae bacterium]